MGALSLIATIGANLIPWERAMTRLRESAKGAFGGLTNNLKGAISSTFGTTALLNFAKNLNSKMIEIGKAGDRLEVSTDQIQEAGAAARKVGLDLDDMGRAIDVINGKRIEALAEPGKARDIFQAAGMDLTSLYQTKGLDLLKRLGEARKHGLIDRDSFGELVGTRSEKLFAALDHLREPHPPIFSEEEIKGAREIAGRVHEIEESFERIASSKAADTAVGWIQTALDYYAEKLSPTPPGANLRKPAKGESQAPQIGSNEFIGPLSKEQQAKMFWGSSLGDHYQKALEDLNTRAFEVREAARVKGMPLGDQQEYVRGRISAAEASAKYQESLAGRAGSEVERADYLRKAADHRLHADELRSELQDLLGSKHDLQHDALARIGGLSAFGGEVATVQKQQLATLKIIAGKLGTAPNPHGN